MTAMRAAWAAAAIAMAAPAAADVVDLGSRPLELISTMEDGPLKTKLLSCAGGPFARTDFSIAHRGAPLRYPEHTVEGYEAAARMGAGIVECDVTFTKDKVLVCRHSQNDLHRTTDILATDLASSCIDAFSPAKGGVKAAAECRTSEITAAEFLSLKGKADDVDETAQTVEAYIKAGGAETVAGTVVTHAQSIALFRGLGVKFMPELKRPSAPTPFDGFTQAAYAQKLIDEYKAAGVAPAQVWPQSFSLDDVLYWIENEPAFGEQAVFLDGRYRSGADPNDPSTFSPSMAELKALGVNYIAPPLWMLLTLEEGEIAPSAYARDAKAAGLEIIAWTVERSGSLKTGGGWYYRSIAGAVDHDGAVFEALHVLARDVGVAGVFSDWPATVTYYANCMGLD